MQHYNSSSYISFLRWQKKLVENIKNLHQLSIGFPIANDPEAKEELKNTLSRKQFVYMELFKFRASFRCVAK